MISCRHVSKRELGINQSERAFYLSYAISCSTCSLVRQIVSAFESKAGRISFDDDIPSLLEKKLILESYSRTNSRFSHRDRLSSVNNMLFYSRTRRLKVS